MTSKVRKHLWLDLEDTVVTPALNGWLNTQLLNVAKIRKFIAEFRPDHVHIFSFAIWNEVELKGFNAGTRPMVEASLGVKLECIPTVDGEITPTCCRAKGIDPGSVDFSEMSAFWGKHDAFRLYIMDKFKNAHIHDVDTEVVLLDDVVMNEVFEWPDLRIRGRVLNIDQMPEAQDLDALLRSSLGNQGYIGHRPDLWDQQTAVILQEPKRV